MAHYGYARCSLTSQNISMQVEQLKRAGCERVFVDEGVSGAKSERPGYNELLRVLKPDDTLTVYKLDRLARSTRDLLDKIDHLTKLGVRFKSLTEHIDLDTAAGELMMHLLGSFASFERQLLIERTKAGMASAKSAGKHIGRPAVMDAPKIDRATKLLSEGSSVAVVASVLGVGRSTLYRHLKAGLVPVD
ncbi:MAG: hypothetical protein CMK09_00070 [Ponticaulis sp.]|nr:hypothetical protein [Ponticaulis sp.]|tara:strand:+ start:38518 stop:39087 length:570 start_codon:yes stop_codon:yes gene_type:complete